MIGILFDRELDESLFFSYLPEIAECYGMKFVLRKCDDDEKILYDCHENTYTDDTENYLRVRKSFCDVVRE